jgi:hypothetical protein
MFTNVSKPHSYTKRCVSVTSTREERERKNELLNCADELFVALHDDPQLRSNTLVNQRQRQDLILNAFSQLCCCCSTHPSVLFNLQLLLLLWNCLLSLLCLLQLASQLFGKLVILFLVVPFCLCKRPAKRHDQRKSFHVAHSKNGSESSPTRKQSACDRPLRQQKTPLTIVLPRLFVVLVFVFLVPF